MDSNDTEKLLREKIELLSRVVWEGRVNDSNLTAWLSNFNGEVLPAETERLYAMFLLSQFMYFGSKQMRELLKSLYRDHYKYPVIEKLRKDNSNITDLDFLQQAFRSHLLKTRFLGVGNPSESGCHLLYYYRQENQLPKDFFPSNSEIIRDTESGGARRSPAKHYVFIDDFCGSGNTAIDCSRTLVEALKKADATAQVDYHAIFGCKDGMAKVRQESDFDNAVEVVELDNSFACFSEESRYFLNCEKSFDRAQAEKLCSHYGARLWPDCPLGYDNCQLLLSFHHNTPDNTLPLFWGSHTGAGAWQPIFPRYPKISISWT